MHRFCRPYSPRTRPIKNFPHVEKFQTLFKDTSFLERDAIFIRLSTKTLGDFQGVAEFANAIKKIYMPREIRITNLPSWIYLNWLLHGLSSKCNCFKMILKQQPSRNRVRRREERTRLGLRTTNTQKKGVRPFEGGTKIKSPCSDVPSDTKLPGIDQVFPAYEMPENLLY